MLTRQWCRVVGWVLEGWHGLTGHSVSVRLGLMPGCTRSPLGMAFTLNFNPNPERCPLKLDTSMIKLWPFNSNAPVCYCEQLVSKPCWVLSSLAVPVQGCVDEQKAPLVPP